MEVNENYGGKPYIITDYIPQGIDINIFLKFMPKGYKSGASFSSWYSALTKESTNDLSYNGYIIDQYMQYDNKIRFYHNESPDKFRTNYNITLGETYEIFIYGKDRKVNINGEELKLTSSGSKENRADLKIFSSSSIEPNNVTYGKLYYFKLIKNDKIELDLIPVRRGTEGFMYDKISGKLYGNSGDGKFILGPDKK